MMPSDGRKRVVIEGLEPEIDGGRFAIKGVVGEKVVVRADVFVDGHDRVDTSLLYRKSGEQTWQEVPMRPLMNDRWEGMFIPEDVGLYYYTVRGWVDPFETWQHSLRKKAEAGQDVKLELVIGTGLIEGAARAAVGIDAERLAMAVKTLTSEGDPSTVVSHALRAELMESVKRLLDKRLATIYHRELPLVVDRKKAIFSAWYERFPRSCSSEPGRHGTFKDCERLLPEIGKMGFDVLYFPPIHPIGRTHRKGRNNSPVAGPGDPGSPWAIGGPEGGHKSVHPELGTLEDFRRLVSKAGEYGIEIALDLAFQCSPDHPYVKEHPEWFRWRPDGKVQHAENPPKSYEDIYPFDFECDQWKALWEELKSVARFWIEQGVRIFRVDNPHTKPFDFWEWLVGGIKEAHPDVIFLAEAFTRPKIMYRLAKLGFSQSYTYFAWRNTKWELKSYFEGLAQPQVRDHFRANLWPNTPDILTEYLQMGGRPAYMARFVLAATLSSAYGIYGPAFELCENLAKEPGSEEYLNSEKYEIRHWDTKRPESLKGLITRVNKIRRENPALQGCGNLMFHPTDNDQLVCYSRQTEEASNIILVVVNLDPHHAHSCTVELPLAQLSLDTRQPYQVHDLLSDVRFLWYGSKNYVELDPKIIPAHIFRIRRRVRTERDFDYFM
jgi:starch synthase (maltosyl-transferring)